MRRLGLVVLWVAASFATALLAWGAVRVAGDPVADRPVRPLSADEVAALAPPPSPASGVTTTVAPATTLPPSTTMPPASTSSTSRPAASSTTTTTRVAGAAPPSTAVPPPPAPATTSTSAATTSTSRGSTSTSSTSTSSTSTSSTSTTTTAPPAPEVLAYQLTGGTVVVRVSPGQVVLASATPNAGFAMEIESSGPEEVRVEFEGGNGDAKFRARWSGGVLDVDIDE